MFCVVKGISHTCNVLVPISILLLNLCTQLAFTAKNLSEIVEYPWFVISLSWSYQAQVCTRTWLFSICIFQLIITNKVGSYHILCIIKVRDRQQNPVPVFVMFCVVNKILWTCNPIFSICLRLMKCCTQLVLSGLQDFEWMCWAYSICDLTSGILSGMISHGYLIVIYSVFFI